MFIELLLWVGYDLSSLTIMDRAGPEICHALGKNIKNAPKLNKKTKHRSKGLCSWHFIKQLEGIITLGNIINNEHISKPKHKANTN